MLTDDSRKILTAWHGHRTGMLSMLLQSIVGVSDEEIIEDYYKSNIMRKTSSSAAANQGMQQGEQQKRRGKLDRAFFSGTNREAIIETLEYLRATYGSIAPGYLDAIGFDSSWRQRLVKVLKIQASNSRL